MHVLQRGYYNMPDMLSVGQGAQTQAQYRAQMLLWSVLGAPLILGADIRKMDAFAKAHAHPCPSMRTRPNRASVCAAPTLNATRPSRVTLSPR